MEIIITGTVGVGKSVTSKKLTQILKEKFPNRKIFLVEELNKNNPYLDYFYHNRTEWAFLLQIDFLLNRFKNSFVWQNLNIDKEDPIIIYDRHFLDDYLFSKLPTMNDDMFTDQIHIYNFLNNFLLKKLIFNSKPDYLFLLEADFEIIMERIKKRGRNYEKSKGLLNYWENLYQIYYQEDFIKDYFKKHCKKMININANVDQDKVLAEILKHL